MGKKIKTKKPQAQRPKGPGAKAPPRRVSTRVKKPAPTAAELAAPAAQRCGRDDCRVCKPQPCNKCAKCKASPKPTAGRCIEAQKLREQPCPTTAPAPRDDGVDPRKLDKKGPHFKASDDIIEIMDALANSTKLEPPVRHALGCFKHSLDVSGRLDKRWASLAEIHALDDYDVDDINADNDAQKVIEAVVRDVHFKDGSKPSVQEMARMGPLEMLTVVRVQSYIAPMIYRTRAQIRPKTAAIAQSHSDQARDTFMAIVEGRKYDGVHVATALARKKDEPWPKYWWRSLDLLKEKIYHLTGARKRFYRLLESVRNGAAVWVCRPEMRAWLEERQCQYQRMMVC